MRILAIAALACLLAGCQGMHPAKEPGYDGPLVREDGTVIEEPSW